MGRGEPTVWAQSRALFRSLMCRSILKPGLSLPSIIMGALAFMTVEPARPPRMAWNTSSGSTPAILARVRASDRAWMLQATIIWLASLVVLPAPTSPQRTTEAPMAPRMSLYWSKTSCLPPTMKERVPSMALGSPPETGASSISMPRLASSAAISLEATGLMELMSMNTLPGFMWAATPSSPSMTAFTWGLLGTMVSTTSQVSPISALVAALAPAATISSTLAWFRSLTVRS